MSYGHPSTSQWGSYVWGSMAPGRLAGVLLDGYATQSDSIVSAILDGLALGEVERSVRLAGVAQRTMTAQVSLDFYAYRLPTDAWRAGYTSPRLLVELRLGGGTVYLSTADVTVGGVRYQPRLVSSGEVLRTITPGSDQVSLTLEDTDAGGTGTRFRDLFRANAPEGRGVTVSLYLEGDEAGNVIPIFEGLIERVPSADAGTIRVDVVRTDVVVDQVLGRTVTLGDFPNAPEESLGRTVPIVFGDVPLVEGVVVDTVAVSRLERALLHDDLEIFLTDGDGFPVFPPTLPKVRIDEEVILYVQKFGDQLRELQRAQDGSALADHAPDSEVVEVSDFVVKFADHPCELVDAIRFLDAQGALAEPVPGPDSLDHATALATWSSLPRLRSPGTEPVFQRVHFKDTGPSNLAENPERAAREAEGYETFGFATVTPGNGLELRTNVEGLGEPGDVQRVWLAVVFDAGNAAQLALPRAGGAQVTFVGLLPRRFNLRPEDLTPREIARNDDRTNDRFYEATLEVEATAPETEVKFVSPKEIIDGGVWTNANPSRIVDGDEDTYSAVFLSSATEGTIVAARELRARVQGDLGLGTYTISAAKLVLASGWTLSPFTTVLTAYLEGPNGKIVGTEVRADTLGPAGTRLGFVRGEETFEVSFDPALLGAGLQGEDLPDLTFVLEPAIGQVNVAGLWVARELRLELTLERLPAADPELDSRRAVTNYFEVTRFVDADWSFFGDLSRGGTAGVTVEAGECRVLEVFWVVEHRPLQLLSTRVPRVFARVRGIAGTGAGEPTAIAEAIVTGTPPLGLGQGAGAIARERYNPAKSSLAADGIRLDFALTEPTSARALLSALAAQSDMRGTWERGRHVLVRKPDVDSTLEVYATLADVDVLEDSLRFSRTALEDVRSRLAGSFAIYAPTGRPGQSLEIVDAAAETTFGRRAETVELGLVQAEAAARVVVRRDLARKRTPRWLLSFELPLLGLDLRFGDLVRVEHTEGTWAACEVLGLSVVTDGGFAKIRVKAIAWEE